MIIFINPSDEDKIGSPGKILKDLIEDGKDLSMAFDIGLNVEEEATSQEIMGTVKSAIFSAVKRDVEDSEVSAFLLHPSGRTGAVPIEKIGDVIDALREGWPNAKIVCYSAGDDFVEKGRREKGCDLSLRTQVLLSRIDFPFSEKKILKEIENFIGKRKADEVREQVLSSLLPLHLSLQAFFGISKDGSEKWVYFGRDESYSNKIKKLQIRKAGDVGEELREGFPNRDAFLLLKEAEWDFYAPIFNRIMPEESAHEMDDSYTANCAEETEEYRKERTLAGLLGNVANDGKLKEMHEAFNCPYGKESNKFVKSLREICAILANTKEDCRKGDKHFVYKGRQEAKKVCDHILRNLRINSKDNKEKHCKLEQNGKRNPYYETLEKQIKEWGVEKAKVVIDGIERLSELLSE